MMITSKELIPYLYSALPEIYRTEDSKIGSPLYRFLEVLVEYGYKYIVDKSNSLLDLMDAEKCPDDIFPYLYESYGLKYSQLIDISYQRKFLKNVGYLRKMRGTYACVRYLVRVLTQLNVELSLSKDYNSTINKWNKTLHVSVKAHTIEDISNLDTDLLIISQYLRDQIPYDVNLDVVGIPDATVLEYKRVNVCVLSQSVHYNLV